MSALVIFSLSSRGHSGVTNTKQIVRLLSGYCAVRVGKITFFQTLICLCEEKVVASDAALPPKQLQKM